MQKEKAQRDIIKKLSKFQKEFNDNLKNKNILFIYENKKGEIKQVEMFFPKSSFYHLTGIKAFDKYNQQMNSYKFYDLLQKNRISSLGIKYKDATTFYKLEILSQLIKIDKNAKMIGDFCENKILLKTQKIVGNINACMGFIKDDKLNAYIPNTALKIDIREITKDNNKIVAVLKKDKNEIFYKNITYLKQKYKIETIFNNYRIKKYINIKKMYSVEQKINERIEKLKNRKED